MNRKGNRIKGSSRRQLTELQFCMVVVAVKNEREEEMMTMMKESLKMCILVKRILVLLDWYLILMR